MQGILRRILLLALAAVLSLGVAACGSDDDDEGGNGGGNQPAEQAEKSEIQPGGELTFNYPSFPDFLDPAMSYTVAGWQALVPTYTQLLTYRR